MLPRPIPIPSSPRRWTALGNLPCFVNTTRRSKWSDCLFAGPVGPTGRRAAGGGLQRAPADKRSLVAGSNAREMVGEQTVESLHLGIHRIDPPKNRNPSKMVKRLRLIGFGHNFIIGIPAVRTQ